MKIVIRLTLLILGLFIFSSCEDHCTETIYYTYQEPIYSLKSEIVAQVGTEEARNIETPEKIYFKDDFIFIVESGMGIHIIDNQEPSSPQQLLFINIPGNHDVAIQDNYLYADNYTDLLVFDVANIENIQLLERIESVFDYYGIFYMESGTEDMIVTSWETVTVEEINDVDCFSNADAEDVTFSGIITTEALSVDAGVGSSGSGTGGSMARFTISKGHLYAVDRYSIRPFNIIDASLPDPLNPINIGWDIETIFPYRDHLFIGSMSGMHIYSIASPSTPKFVSIFQHANACDPVVVQDDIAFVTLRNGTECQTFTNQLEVVDVSDVNAPTLIETYPMDNPHGLGIKDECLYICEGDYGLKYFDASDVRDIRLKKHFKDIHALDVIPLQNNLLMIGNDGFYQYKGICEQEIDYLSVINF